MKKNTNKLSSKKLLIFIVAYNAEQHIEEVLRRIPESIFVNFDYEILIIDDSSKDKTFQVAHDFKFSNVDLNLNILYNPINQGYGGNQKLGYQYAINNNYDAVILLHGDGQYAPELIDDMVKPLFENNADAVFGSRMLEKGKALKGGMPLYKYIGNKILTGFQNKILKTNLSEFHSGYRAYAVSALKKIPFDRNSNDFHFDTQIIIQLLLAKMKIQEIPIPTYYGDEICHVNGIKYGWDVLMASLSSRLHLASIYYKREYDVSENDAYAHSLKLGYTSSHVLAINRVQCNSKVLEIGGRKDSIVSVLKKRKCYVAGMDHEALQSSQMFDKYYQTHLDECNFPSDLKKFDYILMLDIIEDLLSPEKFLDTLREKLGLQQPTIIITSPNIGFFIMRIQLLLGRFNYSKKGILDMRHRRLFTFRTLKKLCIQCGYIVVKRKGIPPPYPKAIGKNIISDLLLRVNNFLIRLRKNVFSYQIYMEIKPTPVVKHMLNYSEIESKKRTYQLKSVK